MNVLPSSSPYAAYYSNTATFSDLFYGWRGLVNNVPADYDTSVVVTAALGM